MAKTYEGNLVATDLTFAIVVSRWNSFITERMLAGAMDALIRHGAAEEKIEVAYVPGTWEIPLIAQRMAKSGRFHAIICIGCLMRGSTPHFEYLANEVTKGIGQVSLQTGLPLTYGIITVENLEQAIERAGTKAGNKGAEAAVAAIEMANLMRELDRNGSG
ncbi:MAG TPA: 6,7-dimethyl-8-ribityllumazine synthase [Chthonomonadales bacterium]|nr:6,7-dimethyl-8-ribityllumazine synthase [Chthonomonadales bacterium]